MYGSRQDAATAIQALVERFQENERVYRASSYNEESTRNEFITPLFRALGWDVTNVSGAAEQYKDCIHEESIKIGGATKAPDYTFRFGGQRKFFLEAKKPAIPLKTDIAAAYQLRRYAWNTKLPVSVLCNFAELAIFDTRLRPDPNDKATVGCIAYYSYDEYLERLPELWSVLSKDGVHRGAFDKFVVDEKKHRGKREVDEEFLADIEAWRERLAKNIALRNLTIDVADINFVVQATIDRVVFLRIAEDRGVEPYGQLRNVLDRPELYRQICEIYKSADAKYNSGLFNFSTDKWSLTLNIDEKPLADMIASLYPPKSPYEFALLPVEILGSVYERFLGKVIRLTPGRHVKVEEKPAVKKSGGVYYTPAHVVNEIVKRTIGGLVRDRAPKELAELRIVDPACGSGSFLLGAYDFLLRHYLTWYEQNNPARRTREVYRAKHGWQLTTHAKKRILLTHIFGVDIDPQAVEVTKLSLLLKVLEGENVETLNQTLKLFAERALPSLEQNIRCGNSLISPQDLRNVILTDEEKKRINAFDWRTEFAAAFKGGGFSAVIGNPPYVRIQTMKEWAPVEVELYKGLYVSASSGNYDLYIAFVEKALLLLRSHGVMGFILPHKFFNSQYGRPLRSMIATGGHLRDVVHFGDIQIFAGATTYTCLLFLSRDANEFTSVTRVNDLSAWRSSRLGCETGVIPASAIGGDDWDFVIGTGADLYQRLRTRHKTLEHVAEIFVGVQTSADDVYIMDLVSRKADILELRSKALSRTVKIEAGILRPVVSGTDIDSFAPLPSRQFILYPYDVFEGDKAVLIPMKNLVIRYPSAAAYLEDNKAQLEARENRKFRGNDWHRFGRSQNLGIQGNRKVCVPRLVDTLHATLDATGSHVLDNVDVGGVTLRKPFTWLGLEYLCGLLNSRLLQWYFPYVSAPFRGGFRSANRQFLGKLPIVLPDLKKPNEARLHREVTEAVLGLMSLASTPVMAPHAETVRERNLAALRGRLDDAVFEIYDLTNVEVNLVLEGTSPH